MWSTDSEKVTCTICNPSNTKKSWLITKMVNTDGYKLIHVDVDIRRRYCKNCRNQDVKVLILSQTLPAKDVAKAREKLNKLRVLTTLENKEDDKSQAHRFRFQSTLSKFSLVFLSQGICTRIKRIAVSSFVCERNVTMGVHLPRTVAPANGTTRVNVSCPKNTLNPKNESAYGLCSIDGMWNVISPCMCKKGYTLAATKEGCEECPVNTYKDNAGNDKCTVCPRSSTSDARKHQCLCKDSFYPFTGDNYTHPCHGVPSEVRKITLTGKTETSITLSWEPPEKSGEPGQKVWYDVECKKCQSASASKHCEDSCGTRVLYIPRQSNLENTSVTVKNLDQDSEYEFVIYSKNGNSRRINKSNWESSRKKIKTEGLSQSDDLPAAVVIGVAVIVIVMMIIIIILVICLLKLRKVRQFRRSLRRNQDFPLFPGEKNFIDPTTYDNPEKAVTEFAKELDRNLIKFEAIIGGGEFGDVYKGDLKLPGQAATKVAIKTLKAGATRKNRTDFLIEASVMGQFKNLNVITLEGVLTKSTPLLIVTEFMENGFLDKYLKEINITMEY